MEIPSITPELTDRTLRTALAVEQRGVFLFRVEFWRIDNPHVHLLTIDSGHPALLNAAKVHLVEQRLVLKGNLLLASADGVNHVNVVWRAHRVANGHQFVACHGNRFIVVLASGYLLEHLRFNVGIVDLDSAVLTTNQVNAAAVGVPGKLLDALVPALAYIGALASG